MSKDALNLDDFFKEAGVEPDVSPEPAKSAEPVKPAEPVNPEPAKPEPVEPKPAELAKPTEPEPVFKPIEIPSKSVDRDVSMFEGEDAELARQMSNKAYERFKEVYKHSKEVTKQPTLEDHPDAYVLDPEYRRAQIGVSYAQFEEQHWRRQLKAITDGDDWQMLSYDENGKPTYETQPATEEALEKVHEYLATALSVKQQKAAQAQQITEGFASRHQERANQFRKIETDILGEEYADLNKLIERSDDAKRMSEFLTTNGQASNILAPTVVKLYDIIRNMVQTNTALATELQGYKTPKPTPQGPVAGEVMPVPSEKNGSSLKLSDFYS